MGREYVIDHCISVLNEKKREEMFRIYLTETIRGIGKSLGCEIKISLSEFLDSVKPQPEPEAPEDIISRIKSKAEALK